jgi:PAS domain-containing protein
MWRARRSRGPDNANRTAEPIDPAVESAANSRLPILWIILGGIALIASITIGAALVIDDFRERALSRSARELENTALLLSRHFDQEFEEISVSQAGLAAKLRVDDMTSPADFKQRLSGADIHALLSAEVRNSVSADEIFLFAADGTLVNTSQDGPMPAFDVTGHAYFKAFQANTATTFAEPLLSRVLNQWTTVLARRLANADGVFLGAMVQRVPPQMFEKFFETVLLAKGASITIAHRNGVVLARSPHIAGMFGKNLSAAPLFKEVVAKARPATARVMSPLDGEDRLAAARPMRDYPIVIVATTTTAAAIVDWREQTKFLIAAACLLMMVIVTILLLIGRWMLRERRVSEQQLALGTQHLDMALTNMSQGLCLFDANRRLVLANRRLREIYWLTDEQMRPGRPFDDVLEEHAAKGDTLECSPNEHAETGSTIPATF